MVSSPSQTSNNAQAALMEEIRPEMQEQMKELHCHGCGRFLALYAIMEGTVAIKCRRCKEITVVDVQTTSVDNSGEPD